MRKISLLPADSYTVINKTLLTDLDKKNLINLYEPIVGCLAISLYLTLWSDLDKTETISKDFTHHHLMTFLKAKLDYIKEARESLEAVGLIKTYIKQDKDINHYIYELYSPISAYDFFNHPVLNVVLYNNIGENEYKNLVKSYRKITTKYDDYEDISCKLNETFKSTLGNGFNAEEIKAKEEAKINIGSLIDFDLLRESIPNNILNDKALNKRSKELINSLAFVYNLDTIKLSEILRLTIDENGMINKESLVKEVRKYYEYNNRLISYVDNVYMAEKDIWTHTININYINYETGEFLEEYGDIIVLTLNSSQKDNCKIVMTSDSGNFEHVLEGIIEENKKKVNYSMLASDETSTNNISIKVDITENADFIRKNVENGFDTSIATDEELNAKKEAVLKNWNDFSNKNESKIKQLYTAISIYLGTMVQDNA